LTRDRGMRACRCPAPSGLTSFPVKVQAGNVVTA
jgi:hypothetical protein